MHVVGANLRAIRRSRNLTQEQFAALIGRKRQFVGSVEAGRQNLRLSTVESLAAGIGVSPSSLFVPGGEVRAVWGESSEPRAGEPSGPSSPGDGGGDGGGGGRG